MLNVHLGRTYLTLTVDPSFSQLLKYQWFLLIVLQRYSQGGNVANNKWGDRKTDSIDWKWTGTWGIQLSVQRCRYHVCAGRAPAMWRVKIPVRWAK